MGFVLFLRKVVMSCTLSLGEPVADLVGDC